MRPVKQKAYQDHTFVLRLIHLSSMKTIFISSRQTTFLDCASLDEDSHVAPPYTNMGEKLFGISSLGHYLEDDHHDTPSSMGYMWSPFCCMLMGKYLTPHRDTKHIDNGLVHKAILTIAHHTMRSYNPSWYITSLVFDQLALSLDQHIIFFF